MIQVPQCVLNEDDFSYVLDNEGLDEDSLIKWMVDNNWSIGKEIDIHSRHYPYGNLYFPPEDD